MSTIGKDTYNLPIPLDDESDNFSFSGLKSAVINLIHNEKQKGNEIIKENMATSFQNRVINIITKKTMRVLHKKNINTLLLAGGVSANKGLRDEFTKLCQKEKINLIIPPLKYCTDNATMIASSGYYAYQKGIIEDSSINAVANISIENTNKDKE